MKNPIIEEELKALSKKAFSIIELVEVVGIPEHSFSLIRKKLLNLGNDILRVSDKVGEDNA